MGLFDTIFAEDNLKKRRENIESFYPLTSFLIATFIAVLLYLFAPPVADWLRTFHRVGESWLAPYSGGFHFAYPPWTTLIFAPFHFIEPQLSRALWAFCTTIACAFTNKTLKGDSFSLLLLVTSIPFISLVGNGQSDGFVILGLGLIHLSQYASQLLGSILILGKPQTLGFVLPFLFLRSPHRWKLLVGGVIFGLSTFVVWGWWIPDMLDMTRTLQVSANWSLWPYGIPAGIILLFLAYKYESRSLELSACATFFLVPYYAWYSFSGLLVIVYSKSNRWVALSVYLFINILSFQIYI